MMSDIGLKFLPISGIQTSESCPGLCHLSVRDRGEYFLIILNMYLVISECSYCILSNLDIGIEGNIKMMSNLMSESDSFCPTKFSLISDEHA